MTGNEERKCSNLAQCKIKSKFTWELEENLWHIFQEEWLHWCTEPFQAVLGGCFEGVDEELRVVEAWFRHIWAAQGRDMWGRESWRPVIMMLLKKNTTFVSMGRDNFRKPHKIRENFVIWQSNTKLVSAPNWWSSITTLPCRCSWISSEARGHPRVCWESQVCWTGQSRNKLHYCTTGNYGLKSISIQQELHQ